MAGFLKPTINELLKDPVAGASSTRIKTLATLSSLKSRG